jgi:hypothetical protein
MKSILLSLFFINVLFGLSFSQPTKPVKFNITKDGIMPAVLTFDASFTADKIYSRAKTWNASVIQYPETATRVDKKNEQLKYGGYIEQAWKINDNNFDHWYPIEYTLNIEIKDGKCRVTFESSDDKYKLWFNSDNTVIKKFTVSKASLETSINKLLTSLYTYIKNDPKKADDNW